MVGMSLVRIMVGMSLARIAALRSCGIVREQGMQPASLRQRWRAGAGLHAWCTRPVCRLVWTGAVGRNSGAPGARRAGGIGRPVAGLVPEWRDQCRRREAAEDELALSTWTQEVRHAAGELGLDRHKHAYCCR